MRSSSKKVKNVSTCSENYPEHGLPKKETEDNFNGEMERGKNGDDVNQRILYSLATKVVQDVVRLASETAKDKLTKLSDQIDANHSSNQSQQSNSREKCNLERVPTILIDTVPSEPSSPTEWPPPREETIVEEDETLDEADINVTFEKDEDASVGNEVKSFATSYVEDILVKALEIASERRKLEDEQDARNVASRFVEEVVSRANKSAMVKLISGIKFPQNDVPTIQIDTIASMPPSPENIIECQNLPTPSDEEPVQPKRAPSNQSIPEICYFPCDDEPEEDDQNKATTANLLKFSEAPDDVRSFATSYVKDIVARAITMAEEKLVNAVPFSFDVNFMKVNGPWYIRAREAIMRILRLACFCTPRRTDT